MPELFLDLLSKNEKHIVFQLVERLTGWLGYPQSLPALRQSIRKKTSSDWFL